MDWVMACPCGHKKTFSITARSESARRREEAAVDSVLRSGYKCPSCKQASLASSRKETLK